MTAAVMLPDGPERGECPLCRVRVVGARVGGHWYPARGGEHGPDCLYAELIWCDECGAGVPWKHTLRPPTWRRRLVQPLTLTLADLAHVAMRLHNRLFAWADRPARQAYERNRWGTR